VNPADGWLERVTGRLTPVGAPHQVGARVWRLRTETGDVVVKLGPGVADEASGLDQLGRIGGAPPVPEIVMAEPDLLVTRWVDQGMRTAVHDEALGRMLAGLHTAPRAEWGGGSSWIGSCRVDPAVRPDGAAFYRARLEELAARCGMEGQVAGMAGRIDEVFPADGPALVHGDLWWGNVLWGADGRPWLIDPSVHGGHPEEDLAMLGLFGTVPAPTWRAYTEVRPLAAGWQERVGLFRLVPLLVHTILFGGGYRGQAETIIQHFS
jgi:fructosamine-3-kinase